MASLKMLLHSVLAGKRLVAFWAVDVLFAGMLLGVACSMGIRGEVVVAGVLLCHRTSSVLLLGPLGRHGGGGKTSSSRRVEWKG